jgi:hypothetical protein
MSLRFETLYESQQAPYRNPPHLQAIALGGFILVCAWADYVL